MKYFIFGIICIIVLFLLIIIIRALCFKPKKEEKREVEDVNLDTDPAIKSLQKLVTFKTISYYDSKEEDDNEFEGLINELPNLFPNVIKTCPLKRFDGRGLLFYWKGSSSDNPTVLMAHYDVVPINEEAWTKPAFEGIIEDGCLWGRGSIDTKVTFNGILSAAEELIKSGYIPKKDIYFAFSGSEEITGIGAVKIVDYFEENHIVPGLVVDEGGAVVENVFPGVKQPCGLIGIAEKGTSNIKFECKSHGGHASSPAPHTPVGIISKACCDVENHPMKMKLSKPVLEMFDTLGRRSTFVYRLIFANLWCFKGILDKICKKSGGELNALVRTTIAFTQMEGSSAPNVIPPKTKLVANVRINPLDKSTEVLKHCKKVINNENVNIEYLSVCEGSRISTTDCEGWNIVKNAVADTWKGSIVSPYLMVQASDSRHYGRISDKVYRFSACDLTKEERSTIHGNDEHIRLETIRKAVEFFYRIMKNS